MKYRSQTVPNSQQVVSRVSFSRKTRFWVSFLSENVGKSSKLRTFDHSVTDQPKCCRISQSELGAWGCASQTPLADWLSLSVTEVPALRKRNVVQVFETQNVLVRQVGSWTRTPAFEEQGELHHKRMWLTPLPVAVRSVVWQLRNWAKGLLLHQTECCRCTKCASAKQLTDCFSHLVSSRVTEGCTESVFWLQCFRSGTMSCMRQCNEELPHGGQRLDVLKNF